MATTDKQKSNTEILKRPARFWGTYSRVARQLEVSRQFVSQVANGKRTSQKVMKALLRDIRRADRTA